MPSFGSRTPDLEPTPTPEPVLERDHEATLTLLLAGVVERRMPIIQIQHGATPADSIGMPVAAWLLGECLLHWAVRWRANEVPPTLFISPGMTTTTHSLATPTSAKP